MAEPANDQTKRIPRPYKPERMALYMPMGLQEDLTNITVKLGRYTSRSRLINDLLAHCLKTMSIRDIRRVVGPGPVSKQSAQITRITGEASADETDLFS